MALVTKAFPRSLTAQELEVALSVEEQAVGTLTALEAGDATTRATFDNDRTAPSGLLLVRITGPAIDLPPGTKLVLRGRAFLGGAQESVSVFRLTDTLEHRLSEPDAAADDYAFITGPEVDIR